MTDTVLRRMDSRADGLSPAPRSRGSRVGAAIAALCAAWLALACSDGSAPVRVRSDGLTLEVSARPTSPKVGENQLEIALQRPDGTPVPDADVHVRVHMPSMGAMPAMGGWAPVVELGGGRYRADFDLAMGGTWQVEIAARPTEDAPLARAEGSLTVGAPGLRLESAGGGGAAEAPHAATPHAESSHAAERAPRAPEQTASAPVPADAEPPGAFRFDEGRLQRSGVRIGTAQRERIVTEVRAVGRIVAEETTLTDVALKVRGWVGEVRADAVGDAVERGTPLFFVYSPELYAAQEEYLQALRSQARARETGAPDRADYLVRSARNRLRLWDVAPTELTRLERSGEPQEQLPIRAPVSGYVVEKNVVEGSAFAPGERLYRIAPLTRIWVEAQVYEFELALVKEGQDAVVTLPYVEGEGYPARVAYVYPTLDPKTRTAQLRIELPNPDLALRPGMFANVSIRTDRGERLVVPESAVLHAGLRSFVFRALGGGRFAPQAVETGLQSGGLVEIRSGLEAGDPIVTSATFLIASESRLRAALEQW